MIVRVIGLIATLLALGGCSPDTAPSPGPHGAPDPDGVDQFEAYQVPASVITSDGCVVETEPLYYPEDTLPGQDRGVAALVAGAAGEPDAAALHAT